MLTKQFLHILLSILLVFKQEVKLKHLTSLSPSESCPGDLGTGGQEEEVVLRSGKLRICTLCVKQNTPTVLMQFGTEYAWWDIYLCAEDSIILTLLLSHVWDTFNHISKYAKSIHFCSSSNTSPQTALLLQQ